jgi:hypothetical protein
MLFFEKIRVSLIDRTDQIVYTEPVFRIPRYPIRFKGVFKGWSGAFRRVFGAENWLKPRLQ